MALKDLFIVDKGTTISHEFGREELDRPVVAQVVDREFGTVRLSNGTVCTLIDSSGREIDPPMPYGFNPIDP